MFYNIPSEIKRDSHSKEVYFLKECVIFSKKILRIIDVPRLKFKYLFLI